MSRQDELAEQRRMLWRNVKNSHDTTMRERKLRASLEARYRRDEKLYEECDRQLAMLDGRYARYLASITADTVKKVKVQPMRDLTEAEIMEIVAELGIELPVVNES